MLDRFVRVTRHDPCPVCGKPDWCIVSRDGQAAICPRTREGSIRYIVDAGYLHRLGGPHDEPRRLCAPPPKPSGLPAANFDAAGAADRFYAAIRSDDLDMLAEGLGVSADSLDRLRTGWSDEHWAYTFPMRNDHNTIIGIRLRNTEGHKWAITGSRAGLFIPVGMSGKDPLLICEGPTDTAALLTLGFDAIGRPSCSGGTDYLIAGLRRRRRSVVIVADRDGPGWQGAQQLARQLVKFTSSLKVVTPLDAKDAREWLRRGLTAAVARAIIASTIEYHSPKEISAW